MCVKERRLRSGQVEVRFSSPFLHRGSDQSSGCNVTQVEEQQRCVSVVTWALAAAPHIIVMQSFIFCVSLYGDFKALVGKLLVAPTNWYLDSRLVKDQKPCKKSEVSKVFDFGSEGRKVQLAYMFVLVMTQMGCPPVPCRTNVWLSMSKKYLRTLF